MTDGPQPGPGGFGAPEPGYGGVQGYGYPAPAYGPPIQPPAMPPAPAYGYPPQAAPAGAPAPGTPLVSIGDISVLSDSIMTPAGALPLRGAVWTVTDMSRTEEKIPPVAIVLAILFFVFCLLGLLFLLMKQKVTTGHVQVNVNSGGRFHSTMIPVSSPQAVADIMGRVNYARSVSM
ncbi:hypothetical protein NGB36_12515 [Streptomyces sp. RB6PN25]|uniref:Uncharacterized protein n=1 Tax=Streptomyces humicola TaxID=2953240 RepID=A0ABT1PUQ7_9ACTN|nr:hypothetical protein [Streptomyces humicola]MCQ4081399.1 hypothetical protein [Streptomyces humicola]